jgi:formylglycine-generating enzyme required for sulfatase activity
VTATGHRPPEHWNGRRPPRGSEAHPVVDVTWHDALAYCGWLSEVTGKAISLPSEAEWEKATRGDKDGRMFPWGESFDATRCNAGLQFDRTTPVGIFSNGASPYDCLDLAGNVWEWVRSRSLPYPYSADDGREDLESSVGGSWVLRGGSWGLRRHDVRCAARLGVRAGYRDGFIGFRVVLRSAPVSTL